MCLDVFPSSKSIISENYNLSNITEKDAISMLKDREIGSWIFRFDYITQKYYLTIKTNNLEYINHCIYYYCKKTDKVYITKNNVISYVYPSLKEYLIDIQEIYDFDLTKQINIIV